MSLFLFLKNILDVLCSVGGLVGSTWSHTLDVLTLFSHSSYYQTLGQVSETQIENSIIPAIIDLYGAFLSSWVDYFILL